MEVPGDGKMGDQLEAEWASFQAMISEDKDLTLQNTGDVRLGSDGASDRGKSEEDSKVKGKRRDSSSSSESGSDKSDSRSESGSSDDSSDDNSEDDKSHTGTTTTAKDGRSKERSKSPVIEKAVRKPRSASSSSESETEKKTAPSQSAGKPNGQSHAEPSNKERRPSRSSPSPKRHLSRSKSHERRRKIRHRSRSHDRKRRRRLRGSRTRGKTSRPHEQRGRHKSRERDDKLDRKSSDRPKGQLTSSHERRRSRSRSPRRRKRPHSRSRRRRHSRSWSPHQGSGRRRRRRKRRKHHPSSRVSRSRSKSRSVSPKMRKKRNEPLNYKEKLKQSFLQVQKQAAEGTLNLDDLAKGSEIAGVGDKPNIQPLMGKDNALLVPSALGVLTPQQALLQTMAAMHQKNVAAMHQKAQELTGVVVPKYYNPASVNPLKYAEQFQKRKLLWGKTKKTETTATVTAAVEEKVEVSRETEASNATMAAVGTAKPKTQWGGALFSQDQDGKQAAKFRKLMGMKQGGDVAEDVETGAKVPEELDDTQLKKHEEMFSRLDQEYEFARMATHTHRGIGLGFTSMHHQFNNK